MLKNETKENTYFINVALNKNNNNWSIGKICNKFYLKK